MNFVIDGNAYLNVAISVTRSIVYRDKSIGAKYYVNDIFNEDKFLLKEQVKIQFRNFCLSYLNSLIAPLTSVKRVHLVFDSKSWRKQYVSEFFDDTSFEDEFKYKGNRKKDNHVSAFFDYFHSEIVPALVNETGINHYRINGAEGDDIIAHLCENLDGDIVIYTVDGDIKQLTYSKDKNIVVIYPKQSSKHKKICVPNQYLSGDSVEDPDDFFSLNESSISESPIKKIVSSLLNREYVEYVVDPVYEIFHKVLRGDAKDNIPKLDKITPTKASKILDLIQSEYGSRSIELLDSKDETFIEFIVKNIASLNKLKDEDDISKARKHLLLNISIIRLKSSFFPSYVTEAMNDYLNNITFTNFNYSKLNNLKNNPTLI